jgi:hypothetical protein
MTDRELARIFRGVTLAHDVPAVPDLAFGVAAERAVGEVFVRHASQKGTASCDALGSWELGPQPSAFGGAFVYDNNLCHMLIPCPRPSFHGKIKP